MHFVYLLSVIVHILAASLWVGGMAFFAIVVLPTARKALDERTRGVLLREAGQRFARVSWATLAILAVTGLANLSFRGVLSMLAEGAFWRSPFGSVLGVKLTLVLFVIAASVMHSREARQAAHGPANTSRNARTAAVGRLTLILSMVVVALAVMLVRGVP